jgi:replicative DNA helicase
MSEIALPTNVEVERLVLGSIMLDAELLHDVRPVMAPDDFSLEKHRRIWRRMTGLYDGGRPVDRVTVANALKDAGELESVDGLSYLVGLDDDLPRLPNVSEYVRLLKDDATRRRIITAADSLIRRAADREAPQSLLDSMGSLALEMAPAGSNEGPVSVRQLVDRIGITELLSPRIARGVPFPWEWLNHATCGMLPGELWVLAGHTSTGKSSAALQTAVGVARAQSKAVVAFSLEMGEVSLFQRALWQFSRVDSERAKRNQLTPEQRKRLRDAANQLCELPLYLDDHSFSVMEIHARLRGLRSRGPLGLVVVDYLQLLRDGGRHNTRAEAVGSNARMLKLLAGEFECPVLLLSQFSRESAKPGKARRPELTDLKESGDIENHANGVWFIHRENLQDQDRVPVEFLLPKQRDGRRNVMGQFWFQPNIQRFDGRCADPGEMEGAD